MKKMMMAMAAALMLAACEKNEPEVTVNVDPGSPWGHTTWTFDIGPGVTQEPMARTRAGLSELEMTDLWVMDFVGEELVQTVHQVSTDDGFGSVTMDLGYGYHTICFCASRGTGAAVAAPVVSWEKPGDTFWHRLTLAVTAGVPVASQTVTLSRVATRLRITPTDVIPEGAAKIVCTPSPWYYGLNLLTGEAADERTQQREVNIPVSYIGTSGRIPATFFGLSPADEWQTAVTVAMVDGDGTALGTVTLDDVTMKRNVTTAYSGGILGKGGTMTIDADGTWGTDDVHEW